MPRCLLRQGQGALSGQYVVVRGGLAVVGISLFALAACTDDSSDAGSTTSTTSVPLTSSAAATTELVGPLADDRNFTLRDDPAHGLCLVIAESNLGCDDQGPVLSASEDPATARFAGPNSPPYEQRLAYGYLPADAVGVFGVMPDGTRIDGALLSAPGTPRIWALPLPSGLPLLSNTSAEIFYVNASGSESPAPHLPP